MEPIGKDRPLNPYLELSFWRFSLLATVVIAFFPWSLLANLLFKGLADTRLLISALLQDYLQTLLVLVVVFTFLLIGLVITFFYFWPSIVAVIVDLWALLISFF